ncbi:MBL fold metallo-hydrolase [Streptomyces sp. NP160]|uniref:ComEC/Rec2 family competence protein n=1 Tax=Streptomyces sp. NP160 TaxID=2586637 RepID=UPI00111A1314|nr:MBL fold metallo-hydrolase [Streptomyces sp. NP160]TNM67627.1 MBL fold metallo-hydrolase [Streptomyces sp. NP160]
MHEIDFLSVENEAGSKSGDAIALRFWSDALGRMAVVVIDAGFRDTGHRVVDHIRDRYKTSRVDLAISTHPDGDHLNGLQTVVESLYVSELFIHRPREHGLDVRDYPNLEAIDALLAAATLHGTTITEPFAGESRFSGLLTVLGPSRASYEQLLADSLAETTGAAGLAAPSASRLTAGRLMYKAVALLERALATFPFETLGEDGVTSARNNTSVVTLVRPGQERWLLTGDAGIPAVHAALDHYERMHGAINASPFDFVQVPHHGSRRNVSPSLLNRWLGPRDSGYTSLAAYVSSAKADPKHPSPKVTNAFGRRGAVVLATEGINIWRHRGTPERPDYGPIPPIGPLVEDDV